MKNKIKYILIFILFLSSCRSELKFPKNKYKLAYSSYYSVRDMKLNLTKKDILGAVCYMPTFTKYSDRGKVLTREAGVPLDIICIDNSIDSIYETFIVKAIDTVKYAYTVEGDILKHKKVYKLTCTCPSDTNRRLKYPIMYTHEGQIILDYDTNRIQKYPITYTYPILSIADEDEKTPQIEVGKEYKFLLISYFARDFLMTEGDYTNILLNDVRMVAVSASILSLNFYTTPNLKGLHYVPNP